MGNSRAVPRSRKRLHEASRCCRLVRARFRRLPRNIFIIPKEFNRELRWYSNWKLSEDVYEYREVSRQRHRYDTDSVVRSLRASASRRVASHRSFSAAASAEKPSGKRSAIDRRTIHSISLLRNIETLSIRSRELLLRMERWAGVQ